MVKSYNPLKSWMAWIGFVLGLIVLGFIFVNPFYLFFFPIQVIALPAIIMSVHGAYFLLPIILFFVGYGIHLTFKSSKKIGWIILASYIIVSIIGTIAFNQIHLIK